MRHIVCKPDLNGKVVGIVSFDVGNGEKGVLGTVAALSGLVLRPYLCAEDW